MPQARLLTNAVRHYAWGSRTVLPALLNQPVPSDLPWAELWVGAHPADPSRLPDGRSLAEVAPDLSFLVKLLAAEVPLSLQAHPDLATARAGFAREETQGVPLTAPGRTYVDANHKPELLVALAATDALCGFRSAAEALDLAQQLGCAEVTALFDVPSTGRTSMAEVFGRMVALSGAQRQRFVADLRSTVDRVRPDAPELGPAADACTWVRRLLDLYPDDPAAAAPILMRLVRLEPGDGLYVGAGVLHAYLHGFGIEVQASSDNVLRAGLTRKPVNIPELLQVLTGETGPAPVVLPRPIVPGIDAYDVPVTDFALWRVRPGGRPVELDCPGARLALCVEGRVSVDGLLLEAGQAAYVPPVVPAMAIGGEGTAFVAAGSGGEPVDAKSR